MKKGQHHTDESKAKLRAARAKQVHPLYALAGITAEEVAAAEAQGLQRCSGDCKAFLPLEQFSGPKCKTCKRCTAAAVQRVRDNWTPEERQKAHRVRKEWAAGNGWEHRRHLLRYFALTPEWYDDTLAAQNGVCALCLGPQDGNRKFFCVDHHHASGTIRGLLCLKCNTALERLDTHPDWAARALSYLARYA